jgi:hypothetical protein
MGASFQLFRQAASLLVLRQLPSRADPVPEEPLPAVRVSTPSRVEVRGLSMAADLEEDWPAKIDWDAVVALIVEYTVAD